MLLTKQQTKLPVNVCVFDKGGRQPRIKFQNGQGMASLSVEAVPKLTLNDSIQIPRRDLDAVKDWVVRNKQVLLNYWFGELSQTQFLNRMKS